jgi:hypothetical protein
MVPHSRPNSSQHILVLLGPLGNAVCHDVAHVARTCRHFVVCKERVVGARTIPLVEEKMSATLDHGFFRNVEGTLSRSAPFRQGYQIMSDRVSYELVFASCKLEPSDTIDKFDEL